jgi:hypothetical protein
MRKVGLVWTVLFCWLSVSAQEINETATADLRALALAINLPHAAAVDELMSMNDSMLFNKKKWQIRYDSLLNDTLAMEPAERALVRLDDALCRYVNSPSAAQYGMLKTQFNAFDVPYPNAEAYMVELRSIVLEIAVEQSDFQLAYSIQNRLHAQHFSDWKASDVRLVAQYDSLQSAFKEMEHRDERALKHMSDTAMQWHLIAMGAILVLLVLGVLFFVSRKKWNKQRTHLAAKANDTSEREALVNKLEEARREIQEMQLVAKKKLEVPVPVQEIALVPPAATLNATEIADWNDQVQQALAKIKSHCEAGKNAMSVPTYMSIINDTTRLSAQVSKKSEQWIALLSAK